MRQVADFLVIVAAAFHGDGLAVPRVTPSPRRGRVYGGGSRAYSGPRDENRRRRRLTPAVRKALNAAWNEAPR